MRVTDKTDFDPLRVEAGEQHRACVARRQGVALVPRPSTQTPAAVRSLQPRPGFGRHSLLAGSPFGV